MALQAKPSVTAHAVLMLNNGRTSVNSVSDSKLHFMQCSGRAEPTEQHPPAETQPGRRWPEATNWGERAENKPAAARAAAAVHQLTALAKQDG